MISVENREFFSSRAFSTPLRRFALDFCNGDCAQITRCPYKILKKCGDMYRPIRLELDTVPVLDGHRQMDEQKW